MSENKINLMVGADMSELDNQFKVLRDNLSQSEAKGKSAFQQLQNSIRATEKDYKSLVLTQGLSADATLDAANKLNELRNAQASLNAVTAQAGAGMVANNNALQQSAAGIQKQGVQVQQTARKFDSLGNSLNQITRELPAFTFSAQTGFLAISNNLPTLADEISRLSAANKELAASGQPVKSVFSQVASSLFSWQTGLSIAITLTTVFAKEIINATAALFENEEALKKVQQNIDKLTLSTANNAAGMKIWLDIYGQTLSGKELDLYKARQSKETRFQEIVKQTQAILIEESKTGQKNIIARNMVYASLLQNTKAYNQELEKINQKEKSGAVRGSAIPTQLQGRLSGLGELNSMADNAIRANFENSLSIRWEEINAKALRGMDEWKANFKGFISDVQQSVLTLGDIIGPSLNALSTLIEEATFRTAADGDNFGKAISSSLLGSMGTFMKQWGAQLILVGIGAEALKKSLLTLNGVGAIIAGGLLVAAGAAASSMASSMARNPGGSGGGNNVSGGYATGLIMPNFAAAGLMVDVNGVVQGNNIIISNQNQIRQNRRIR